MNVYIGSSVVLLGAILVGLGHGTLYLELKTSTKGDTNLTLSTMKSAYTLVIGGLIIIILGLLYLMDIIPW